MIINLLTMQYPCTLMDVRLANPNSSFADIPSDDDLSALGFARVLPTEKPSGDVVTEEAPAIVDGKWQQSWSVREFTPEEKAAHDAQLRADRESAIAAARYAREIAGILWRGYGIATDRESQAKIDTEERAAEKGLRMDGKGWKCVDLAAGTMTFRPTTNVEMQEIAAAAYGYVSACFAREEALLAALDAGDYSDSMLSAGWPSQQVW